MNRCNDDILHNILGRLPALTFANAACVSKTWYRICSQILSRPKLASALSLNPSLVGAVAEVLEKVLSKPIRPHFAIACIGEKLGLRGAHILLSQTLGSSTPLVTHIGNGVMGMDALTNQLREVKWDYFDYNRPHPREAYGFSNLNRGIVLVVGYVPGLKVDALPLFRPKADPGMSMTEKFVRDIKAYSASVSGCESPASIMMFGDRNSDMNTIVAKMDYATAKETVMVGDGGGCFLFSSVNYPITPRPDSYILDAVALVFAKDKHKSPDVGETLFHVVMAGGLVPFGPRFQAISVGVTYAGNCSCLSASMEGLDVFLNFQAVIDTVLETVSDRCPDLYIAVAQRRKYHSRAERVRLATSTAFYKVLGGEGEYLLVDGIGIRPGDTFLFYHRDLETARTTNSIAYDNLKMLKENTTNQKEDDKNNIGGEEAVFGGLIFSCGSRGESYFGRPNADIYPFSLNFPGVPFAGVFCKGEIGRGSSTFIRREDDCQEQCPAHCCLHASSAVYLAMSYVPAPSMDH